MSRTEYDDFVAYSRQHFEEGLIRAGFTETDLGWQGRVRRPNGDAEVLVTLLASFPFKPPRVVPVDRDSTTWSWHRELDGALCLVGEDDHEGLWWTDAAAFLEHVAEWFKQAWAGWPNDRPDLDLDRYFKPSEDGRIYLYDDLAQYCDGFVRFRTSKNDTMQIASGRRPGRAMKSSKVRFGYVTRLGQIDVPPRTWRDISSRIDPGVNLDRAIRDHTIAIVVLTYSRGTHDGAITLEVWPTKDGNVAVRRLRSGSQAEAAKTARAGLMAPELRGRRVAVVGVGAVGSFVVDLLVRSGTRHLTLVDGDVVMPGNLVRHVVDTDAVGLSKVAAVKEHLVRRHEIPANGITVVADQLTSGAQASDLLANHDLVLNATADFATTALLHVTAKSLGKRILSVAIQNGGATYRIDLLPPLDGATVPPIFTTGSVDQKKELFEAGCGSPISPTPPHAVVEAAAATVRHAIGLLVGRPLHPAGETRNVRPESEERITDDSLVSNDRTE